MGWSGTAPCGGELQDNKEPTPGKASPAQGTGCMGASRQNKGGCGSGAAGALGWGREAKGRDADGEVGGPEEAAGVGAPSGVGAGLWRVESRRFQRPLVAE